MNNVDFGHEGEEVATEFLQKLGWRIIERNWRAGRFGEVDIIAMDLNGALVFIEVKTRCSLNESDGVRCGFEAIHGLKQRTIVNNAMRYLAFRGLSENEVACRFDVIIIYFRNHPNELERDAPEIVHVRDAFHGLGWS